MNGKRKDVNFDWFDIYQKMQNFYEQQFCYKQIDEENA
mgnify:CR=1 FL=1